MSISDQGGIKTMALPCRQKAMVKMLKSFLVAVILSSLVERFGVSRMRDFCLSLAGGVIISEFSGKSKFLKKGQFSSWHVWLDLFWTRPRCSFN